MPAILQRCPNNIAFEIAALITVYLLWEPIMDNEMIIQSFSGGSGRLVGSRVDLCIPGEVMSDY